MILPQSKPSPHSSPSWTTRCRNAPARPGVNPPPVPAGKDELAQSQLQPLTTTQRQTSPQVNNLPPMKSEQKQKQAPPPPPPSGFLASLVPKNKSQPSAVPKPRPDPPTRPPPPCPVNKALLVTHFYLFIYLFFVSFFFNISKVTCELCKMSLLSIL